MVGVLDPHHADPELLGPLGCHGHGFGRSEKSEPIAAIEQRRDGAGLTHRKFGNALHHAASDALKIDGKQRHAVRSDTPQVGKHQTFCNTRRVWGWHARSVENVRNERLKLLRIDGAGRGR